MSPWARQAAPTCSRSAGWRKPRIVDPALHVYPTDGEGHINELSYGVEQIGWTGHSKPLAMHGIRSMQPPALPHRSEFAVVNDSPQLFLSLDSGYRRKAPWPETFDVGGALLARPFKVSKIGPVRIFVDDVDAALDFDGNLVQLSWEMAQVSWDDQARPAHPRRA